MVKRREKQVLEEGSSKQESIIEGKIDQERNKKEGIDKILNIGYLSKIQEALSKQEYEWELK